MEPVLVYTTIPTNIPLHHVLIKVDRFGFSANNITYQALGEAPHFRFVYILLHPPTFVLTAFLVSRYYDYHPAPEAGTVSYKTHGLVPVWGFGTIVKSTHPRIPEGERVYGYLAPIRYLLLSISPTDVNKHAFYVTRPHLPAGEQARYS
jgi:hypothetical protein